MASSCWVPDPNKKEYKNWLNVGRAILTTQKGVGSLLQSHIERLHQSLLLIPRLMNCGPCICIGMTSKNCVPCICIRNRVSLKIFAFRGFIVPYVCIYIYSDCTVIVVLSKTQKPGFWILSEAHLFRCIMYCFLITNLFYLYSTLHIVRLLSVYLLCKY